MEKNIKKHEYRVGKLDRQKLKGHNSFLIFFTGLSGSGKSTIANALEEKLNKLSVHTYTLDGDNMRFGLNKDLSFTPEDRTENIRRIGETAKLFVDAGVVTLAAFVAPYEKDRKNIEDTVKTDNFVEVFVNTSLEECERRDVKGLYKKARAGEIKNMTGISAPYEAPQNPTVEVSHLNSVEESVEIIFQAIKNKLEIKE
ncbi:adenylyl-sulfate kinase [Tamlana sp. 62-3]|uniref:Adenylyl-sulfate kinase n=1 Tax=Neotamlana sargassicola TaxID=2883125 RepID=A0A9X1I3P0_9FLAO|nr:adenylyl-sulfate kinase [Tamlana sargassicola]MCB4807300.1 adenylyl-sulfate kinase [Tamlana sargassicola]